MENPMISFADQTTSAVMVVVGVAVVLQGFVFAAVTMLRGMVGEHPQRRIILPVAGVMFGWTFTVATLLFMEVAWTSRMAALVFLAGFWSYVIAAGLHTSGKDARK